MRRIVTIWILLLAAGAAAAATPVPLERALRLDPPAPALPAFHADETGGVTPADLPLAVDPQTLDPAAGRGGWRTADLPADLEGDAPVWFAVRLQADRWLKPTLELTTAHPVQAWLDGAETKLKEEDGVHTAELTLVPGDHVLLVRSRRDAEKEEARRLAAALELPDEVPAAAVRAAVDPARPVDIHDVLDAPRVGDLAVSPDGELAALALSAYGPDGERERWFEIRDTRDGDLVETWRGLGAVSDVAWHPRGRAFSYVQRDEGKATVWLFDLETRAATAVLRGLEHFGGYAWNPDGRSLVYSLTTEHEDDGDGMKRLRAIEDRWPWWRNRSHLYERTWPEGLTRRLTAGEVTATGFTFDAAGAHLIVSRTFPDPLARPYSRTEWYELDLATLAAERILAEEERWISDVFYGPDRNTLIVAGSPSAFDGIGRDLPEGVQPNDYGGQLFRYDRAARTATPLTRDLDPTVQRAVWHAPSGRIVAQLLDTQYVRLAAATPDGDWTVLDAGVEVVGGWDVARRAGTIAARGTGAASPQTVHALDVKKGRPRLLLDPGAARYEHVTFGAVQPFVATLPDGMELDGRVYYPRDYQAGRKYPVIVYYYGGTSPITRDYGGRYPKNVWAANGYFVYVPNPSGALGYGQEYAARHVNDWGRLTAPEVIEGTKAFLAAHPDADAAKVGCIGASYGGFLTMHLITQTDMFAAAVSHAGISSISSYWAEGYWGYGYGARALANSFPWNDPELYVGQSPLFHADAITTPLLLLHGFDDTNVPKGESDGLYIALKMLDRDVEYVQVAGQDHHILDHDKRVRWNDVILAYFGWKLKGRDGWWTAMDDGKE